MITALLSCENPWIDGQRIEVSGGMSLWGHAETTLLQAFPSSYGGRVMSIAGQVSREMLEHYSHGRLEAKRRAAEALSHNSSSAGLRLNGRHNRPIWG